MYRLIKIELRRANLHVANPHLKGELGYQVDYEYSPSLDEEGRLGLAQFQIRVNASVEEESAFTLEVSMFSAFHYDEDEDIPAETFMRTNAPAWFFPFVRELVANLTARLPYSPVMLPATNIVKLSHRFKDVEVTRVTVESDADETSSPAST